MKTRLMWLILCTLFIGPLVLASWFYAHPERILGMATVNHGYLFQPPLNVNDLAVKQLNNQQMWGQTQLHGHWWLVFYAPQADDKQWQHGLYQMRQVRKALGKDQERVERIMIAAAPVSKAKLVSFIQQDYQGTLPATVPAAIWDQRVTMSIKNNFDLSQGSFYIVDPHGNLILAYPAAISPRHLYEDLTRLLRASSIG